MSVSGHGLLPGTRLQELWIERELGSGGFGITYLARDLSLDRQVAVKEYLPRDWATRRPDGTVGPRSPTSSGEYAWGLDRFLKEARILAGLDHRGIVRVHRIVEADGTAYIVMEHVDGRSLQKELMLSGPLREARVRQLLAELAAGLAMVHEAGLLHRDVKPANVMLRKKDGSPVLIDFGAARQQMGRQSRALTAVLTPGYAPLEQYDTQGRQRQGPWTDVYALGAVAYEALSGRIPDETPGRVLADELPSVERVAAHRVSEELGKAVMAALAIDPARRPQTVAELMEMLEGGSADDSGALQTEIVPHGGPSPRVSCPDVLWPESTPRRPRWPLWGVGAGAALLAAGLLFNPVQVFLAGLWQLRGLTMGQIQGLTILALVAGIGGVSLGLRGVLRRGRGAGLPSDIMGLSSDLRKSLREFEGLEDFLKHEEIQTTIDKQARYREELDNGFARILDHANFDMTDGAFTSILQRIHRDSSTKDLLPPSLKQYADRLGRVGAVQPLRGTIAPNSVDCVKLRRHLFEHETLFNNVKAAKYLAALDANVFQPSVGWEKLYEYQDRLWESNTCERSFIEGYLDPLPRIDWSFRGRNSMHREMDAEQKKLFTQGRFKGLLYLLGEPVKVTDFSITDATDAIIEEIRKHSLQNQYSNTLATMSRLLDAGEDIRQMHYPALRPLLATLSGLLHGGRDGRMRLLPFFKSRQDMEDFLTLARIFATDYRWPRIRRIMIWGGSRGYYENRVSRSR